MPMWVSLKISLICYQLNQAKVRSLPFVAFYKMINGVNELKIVVKWLYAIFSKNKVTKLLIREFILSKCEFIQSVNFNKYELKQMYTWFHITKFTVICKGHSFSWQSWSNIVHFCMILLKRYIIFYDIQTSIFVKFKSFLRHKFVCFYFFKYFFFFFFFFFFVFIFFFFFFFIFFLNIYFFFFFFLNIFFFFFFVIEEI